MADFSESAAQGMFHMGMSPVWGRLEQVGPHEMLENTRDDTKRYRTQKTILIFICTSSEVVFGPICVTLHYTFLHGV